MDKKSESPFEIPRHLGWVFLAGVLLAAVLVDFLVRQRNPFERAGPFGGVPIAVLYVEGKPGGAALAGELEAGLGPALRRAGADTVVARPWMLDGRRRMGLPTSGALSPRQALGLATLVGAKRMVVGSVGSAEGRVFVEARMLAVSNGRLLGSAGDTVSGDSLGVMFTDSLAARLLRQIDR